MTKRTTIYKDDLEILTIKAQYCDRMEQERDLLFKFIRFADNHDMTIRAVLEKIGSDAGYASQEEAKRLLKALDGTDPTDA